LRIATFAEGTPTLSFFWYQPDTSNYARSLRAVQLPASDDGTALGALACASTALENGDVAGAEAWFAGAEERLPGDRRCTQNLVLFARLRSLAGRIAEAKGRYVLAAEEFKRALEALHDGNLTRREPELHALLVWSLAFAAAEITARDPYPLHRDAQAVGWASQDAPERLGTLRHLAAAYAHIDKPHDALFLLRGIAESARSQAWVAIAYADCVNLMHGLREAHSAKFFYGLACEALDEARACDTARLAHLQLAMAAVRLGCSSDAQRFLAEYEAAFRLYGMRCARDPRFGVFQDHARMLVLSTKNRVDGYRGLSRVHHDWRRMGFTWRAIETRYDLASLQPKGYVSQSAELESEALRERAAEERSAEEALPESVLSRLKVQHIEILRFMLQGKTKAADLSEHTGYAERTVINKLQDIYNILGVRRKIDAVSLCHTDPGLKKLLGSQRE
jgi:tetratricopeptide (TPR) repeat protein